MANCIYKYKGKDYTKEEFYSLVRTTMVQPRTVQKYTKILFPTGNTASKVEGHTTLEEFKKQKENRIKELEKEIEPIITTIRTSSLEYELEDDEDLETTLNSFNGDITELEKEIKNLKVTLSTVTDAAKQTITEVQQEDVEAKVRELEKEGLLEIDCQGE